MTKTPLHRLLGLALASGLALLGIAVFINGGFSTRTGHVIHLSALHAFGFLAGSLCLSVYCIVITWSSENP